MIEPVSIARENKANNAKKEGTFGVALRLDGHVSVDRISHLPHQKSKKGKERDVVEELHISNKRRT